MGRKTKRRQAAAVQSGYPAGLAVIASGVCSFFWFWEKRSASFSWSELNLASPP